LKPVLGPDPWDRRDLAEARADLAAWIGKWQGKYPRLVRALCVEIHEDWLEARRYLNMDYLRELKKEALRQAA
jgi:transposase-like protein